jgi:murein DD-endopeptidase MepM/ murein hydrolase activator NlpD
MKDALIAAQRKPFLVARPEYIRLRQYIRCVVLSIAVATAVFSTLLQGAITVPPRPLVVPVSISLIHPVRQAVIKQTYGHSYSITNKCVTNNVVYNHTGIDYGATKDPDVLAAAAGRVIIPKEAGSCTNHVKDSSTNNHGLGQTIIIEHATAQGPIYTLYAHLSSIKVAADQRVEQGQKIAEMGNDCTGTNCTVDGTCSGNVHLHFELKSKPTLQNPVGSPCGASTCAIGTGDPCYGYTQGNPDNYGYYNPLNFIGATPTQTPTAPPVATFSMSANGTVANNGSSLPIPIAAGSTVRVHLNGTGSTSGGGGGVNFAWKLQPTVSPQGNLAAADTPLFQSNLPSFDTPALSAGSYTVTLQVTNSSSQTNVATGNMVITPSAASSPSISSLNPVSLAPSPFNLTISGSNFDGGAIDQIYFGNNFVGNGTIISRSSTQIVVQESMSTATLGTYTVKVKNSDGQLSNGMPLVLTQTQSTAPSITQITPASVAPSVFDLTINGNNFDGGAIDQIFFGSSFVGNGAILSRSSTQIRVRESMSTAGLGTYTVKIKNSDGRLSNGVGLTLTPAQGSSPSIASVSPASPTRNDNNQNITVSGSGFQSGLTVTVLIPGGGTATLSGTQIQGVSSGSFTMVITLNVVGQYGIRVNNPDGGQSNIFNFNVQNSTATPQITAISPSTPTRTGSDQNVQVTGSNFQSGLTVTVFIPGGGTATLSGSQIQGVTASSFTMVVTLNVAGMYGIRVNNPDGGQSNTFNFTTQTPSLSISSISPATPTRSGSDQNVVVNGSGFQSGLTVTVSIPGGGTATLSGSQIQGVTASSFTMVVTLNVAGTYGIRVNNPDGGQSNTFNFTTQTPSLSISSISPATPTRSGSDQNVVVNGNGFQSGLTVTVSIPGGGTATLSGTQIQGVNSSSFTMVVTLNVAGTYGIRVNNPDGGQSNTFNFTTQTPPVSIGSISPATPTRSGSDQNVVVNGSAFQSGLTVTVFIPGGGTATLSGSQIQGVTASSFTMVVTLNVAGTYGIRVNNPDGGQSNTFNFSTQASTPSIASLSPSTPTRSGSDQNVVVTGSRFQSGLTVTVSIPGGGTATLSGAQIQGVTASSFTMVVTLNVAGTYGIRVNNPDGGQSNTFNFTTQSPTVSIGSISPATPTRSGSDQNVVVNGSGFQSGLTVTVFIPGGGTATLSGSQIQGVTSSSFTMVVTLNVAGTYGIRVNNPDGGQSNTFNFTTQAATPSISSISPSTPTRSGSNQNVQVFGSNFQSGLTVTVFIPGGSTATLSGSQIQSVTSSSFTMVITLNVAGTYGIRVNNPDGTQSNTFNFSTQASTVSISSISPATPTRTGSDQSVQVFGSNFQSGLTVTVFIPGGGTATLSGSQIQSVTSGSFTMVVTLNVAGTYGIRVNNPDGGQSNTFNFTTQAATPSINSISPSTPTRSSSNQNVQVFGSNFQTGLTVTVFIPGGSTSTLSGSQIQSVTSSSFTMAITLNVAGTYGIRVNNPDGTQSNTFNFTTQAPTPSISSISPATPTRSGSDQNVVVSGSGFQSGLTVTVFIPGGGTATLSGPQIQNVTAGSFTIVVTLNVAGTYGIRVNNPDGGQSNTFNFTTQAPTPSISSISPSTPTRSGSNQNVQVFGSSFQSGLTVTVFIPGGSTATLSGSQIQSVTSSSFTMVVTLNVAGTYGIRVNNPDGSQSNTFNFTTQAATPSISSISPSTPTRSGSNQNVQVFGSNFQSGLTVTVFIPGGSTATLSGSQIQSVTSNSFTMVVTLNVAGTYGIRVNNPDGTQSNTFNFTTQAATPSISSISPSTPTHSGSNQNVTVFGSNFQSGLTVLITFPGGGSTTLSGSQIQSVTSSSFVMVATLSATGSWSIRVNNPDGTQSNTFFFSVQ